MGINIDKLMNEMKFDEKLITVFNTYEKYINFRFDYVIRTGLNQMPDELNHNVDYTAFDPTEKILLACINSTNIEGDVTSLRGELKTLTKQVNKKRKEINLITLNENGLKNNIKHLQDIISIKETFISDTFKYTEIKCKAKDKILKEYQKTNKKLEKALLELKKANKKKSSTNKNSDNSLTDKIERYEGKIKKMNKIIKIADESQEKLEEYQTSLQTSKNRLKIFYDQLNNHIKNKQESMLLIMEKEKRICQLKINLSNLGVLSSTEKSRVHTSSNLIEDDNLKKEFLILQNLRNEILSSRPKGMFNPKYQKENSLTKEDIRRYFKNDEVIDSIDYLIELKNSDVTIRNKNLHKYKTSSNETKVFLKCLSTLNKDEIKHLFIHYLIKVVDLKEAGRENDEIVAKLDEINDRQRQTIVSINSSYQDFHLSIEKKCVSLKRYYQDKINMLFELLQQDNTILTVFKLKQEISSLKKKINELEKSRTVKSNHTVVPPEPPKNIEQLEASKSGSETVSSTKVTYHKNKLKIQKNKK